MAASTDLGLQLEPLPGQEEPPTKGKPFQDIGREPSDQAKPSYQGPDRRKAERRTGLERREEFRFEPGKDDRRKGKDRRTHSRLDDTVVW